MARRRAMLCTALVAGVGGAAGFTIPLHQLRVKVGGSEMNVAGADEDVYYVTVNVGTPPQPFRVKLDTSSYDLVLPSGVAADAGPSACTTCHAKRHPGYNPQRSSTSAIIGCHDDECASVPMKEEGALPAICTMEEKDGSPLCPRVPSGPGQGQCVTAPDLHAGTTGLVACQDHLDPPCSRVVNAPAPPGPATPTGHYLCDMDMGQFGAALRGHQLSEYCPETCGVCDRDATRYCADNADWTDEHGHRCHDYAKGSLHNTCFQGEAYVACPVSCGACGDCCASFASDDDGCFFRSFYGESKVFGVKYQDSISLHARTDQSGDSLSAPESIFGLITDEENNFMPNEEIDGVWGLGMVPDELNCNPSCGSMQPFSQFLESSPGLDDLFGICLDSDGISSWDIGVVDRKKYSGEINYVSVVPDSNGVMTEYDIGPPTSIEVGNGNPVSLSSMHGLHTIVDIHTPNVGVPTAVMNDLRTAFLRVLPESFSVAQLSSADLVNSGCVAPAKEHIQEFASFVAGGDAGLQELGLPTVTIGLSHGSVELQPADYLAIEDDIICLDIVERQDDYMVLGRPVMLSYYTIFDREHKRVGFGKSKGLCILGEATCEEDQFECNNGECIPSEYLNDEAPDCRDESDEALPNGAQPVHHGPTGGGSSHSLACSPLPDPPNGHVAIDARKATYSCSPGYSLRGLQERACLPTGAWVGTEPVCQRGGKDSSSTCASVDNEQCEAYLSNGITCATLDMMSLDCRCACGAASVGCDEAAVTRDCSNPDVISPDDLCGNVCSRTILAQWDNCGNDAAVSQIMSQFANVRNYCASLPGGGGH